MTKVKDEYDVIVIGAGVNGLTAAAYLQKAGLEVAVFERRDEEGTHCATEEVGVPGIKYNLHACGLMPHGTPPYADLELEGYIFTRAGLGSFVADVNKEKMKQAKMQEIRQDLTRILKSAEKFDISADDIIEDIHKKGGEE